MAQEQHSGSPVTIEAGSDLSTKQYFLASLSSGRVATTGAGAAAIGIILSGGAAAGRATTVLTVRGAISKAVAGAAVAVNDALESDSSGRVITRSSGVRVGIALEAAGAAGDIISILTQFEGA